MEQARTALKESIFLRQNSDTTLGAINRAYSAMFYAVLALLQQKGMVPGKHSGAIALFDSEFVRKGIFPEKLSVDLHRAFEFRQESDYHAIEPVAGKETDEIIKYATDFVQAVATYLRE
jgi:uncharacterized protein (UPF0332 family)